MGAHKTVLSHIDWPTVSHEGNPKDLDVTRLGNLHVLGLLRAEGGMLGGSLPQILGTWFYVDPTSGNALNDGKTPLTAFASIVTAYAACTTGAGDGICLFSRGGTSSATTSYLAAVIDWAKHGITVVGIASPTKLFGRARISASVQTLAYLIDVQGDNNTFINVHLANFGTDAAAVSALKVSGNRNTFINAHALVGIAAGAAAGARSLELNAAEETTFIGCAFGTDTVDRGDNASCEVLFDGTTERSRFYGCEFFSRVSTGVVHGAISSNDGGSIYTNQIFSGCIFHCKDTAQSAVLIGTAPDAGWGVFIFVGCTKVGYTAYRIAAITTQAALRGCDSELATSGSLSYLNAGASQAIVTLENTLKKHIHGILLDCNTLTQNGVLAFQVKVDGTNYRTVASATFTVATDDSINLAVNLITSQHCKFIYTEGADEGADRALPYEVSYTYLE